MDQTVRIGVPTHEVLAGLPIPARLSDSQQQGHVCVWGGEALTSETAVDLGSRKVDGGGMIFPRSCRVCLGHAALNALWVHASGPGACPECQVSPDCTTGRALNRLIRQTHR
ncbi:hypothetical protein [Streptomyces sp. NPDC047000]|uniref:hypothetical protein n=1 Tax=Streptomyces sp. NPDC047000 TaxID=3155474 RepID=UPI0033D28E84